MRALYAVAPAAAVALIMANAFYGDAVFGAYHPEAISKYSVYVHLQDGWASHPGSLLFEVTDVWGGRTARAHHGAPPEHNYNRVGSMDGRGFVELRHGFSDCGADWQPILYRYGLDTVRNAYEAAASGARWDHPYALMYPDVPAARAGDAPRYAQFVPVCGEGTYEYSVRTDDPAAPVDVSFVHGARPGSGPGGGGPGAPGGAYEGCSAESHVSLSRRCGGIAAGGGLLISVPDVLDRALTKITVNLREVPPAPAGPPA